MKYLACLILSLCLSSTVMAQDSCGPGGCRPQSIPRRQVRTAIQRTPYAGRPVFRVLRPFRLLRGCRGCG